MRISYLALSALVIMGCDQGPSAKTELDAGPDPAAERPAASENWLRDILSYDLAIDLAAQPGA